MVVSSPISTDPSPIGSPDNSVHHSHSRLLSAILVTLNVAVILLIYVLFWRFFWRKKRPSDQSNHNGSPNSTTSSPSNSPRARRTDGNVIASLPVFVHELTADTDRVECSVCLSEVKIGERCRVLPRCSHKFHVECVDMWFQFHSTCPLCRAAIDSKAAAPPPDPDSGAVATNGDELV